MKGVVFTEFLSFVTARHGEEFVDDMMHEAGMAHAAYTSVGTYDFAELAKLVGTYCTMTETPFPQALHAFGWHLSQTFQSKFPGFYAAQPGLLEFLKQVDGQIHVEVRKLYPDAELPRFAVVDHDPRRLVVDYASCRPLADLAVGLIQGSSAFYGEQVRIERQEIEDEQGSRHRFEIALV